MTKSESPRRHRRRLRLIALLAEVGSAAQMERDTGTPSSYLSALVKASRGVGDELAEKLESHYNKPAGWFDLPMASPADAVANADEHKSDPAQAPAGARPEGASAHTEKMPDVAAPDEDIPLSARPTGRNLTRTLWLLANQLAALPEAPRKSVLYFIQQIGNAPADPRDWIAQAQAVMQTVPSIARGAESSKAAPSAGLRDQAAKEGTA